MLTTRTSAKLALGIPASDTTEDSALDQLIRDASWMIRNYCQGRYLCGVCSQMTVADPTVVTCLGHGLETGDVIYVYHSDCTPTMDGQQTVTRVSDDTFTVDGFEVTSAGTAAVFVKRYTEFYGGNGTQWLELRQRPVISLSSVAVHNEGFYGEPSGAFASGYTLTAGTDYVLRRDENTSVGKSRSGLVYRIGNVWPRAALRTRGLLTQAAQFAAGNIKVVYFAGYHQLPADLQRACNQTVGILRHGAQWGRVLSGDSVDFSNASFETAGPDGGAAFGTVQATLKRYRKWII